MILKTIVLEIKIFSPKYSFDHFYVPRK